MASSPGRRRRSQDPRPQVLAEVTPWLPGAAIVALVLGSLVFERSERRSTSPRTWASRSRSRGRASRRDRRRPSGERPRGAAGGGADRRHDRVAARLTKCARPNPAGAADGLSLRPAGPRAHTPHEAGTADPPRCHRPVGVPRAPPPVLPGALDLDRAPASRSYSSRAKRRSRQLRRAALRSVWSTCARSRSVGTAARSWGRATWSAAAPVHPRRARARRTTATGSSTTSPRRITRASSRTL